MDRLINAMPWLTGSALAIVSVSLIAWQALNIQTRSEITMDSQGQAPQSRASRPTPAESIELTDLTFFGEPGENTAPKVTQTESLPETNLRLVLRGVMAGDDARRDSALVEGPDGQTEVYRLDESLPGNATLIKVYSKRIVIERSGELETLSFPENETGEQLAVVDSIGRSSSGDKRNSPRDSDARQPSPRARTNEDVRTRLNRLRERLRYD